MPGNREGDMVSDEMRVAADHFSRPEIVREMHDRNKNGLKPWEKHVVNRFFKQNALILDIGCGTGREAFALADMGFQVVGIDVSEAQIAIAKDEAKSRRTDVVFEICFGMNLKYPKDGFDHIIMWAQAFGNVYGTANQVSLLKECHRALKPAGNFCFSGHDYEYIKGKYPQYTDGKKFFAYADTECYWELFTAEELRTLCAQAGFEVVECCDSVQLGSKIENQVLVCVAQKPGQVSIDKRKDPLK
jgi:ubiquinone/menaquinone biosynthesis C-methylase UbiE